jgi:fibronectin-binding autotransporter adhesin
MEGNMALKRLISELVLSVLVVTTSNHASATNYYWDKNGSTSGAGDAPSGIWGADSAWNTNSAGGSGTFVSSCGSADALQFVANAGTSSGEQPYTVSVTGNQNANGIVFQSSGAPTLAGTGAINLWNGGLTVSQYGYGVSPQGAVTILPQIIVQASQTWTNNSSNPLTIGGNVTNGENTLTVSGAGTTIISGILGGGNGGLVKSGIGSLILQSANSFSGITTIGGGTLVLANSGALQGATVAVPTAGSIVFDQAVSSETFGFGSLSGGGNLSLQNNASSPVAIALMVGGNNGSAAYSGVMSGSGSLTKVGGGTLVLSGSNTYTGGTAVCAGMLTAISPAALPGYSSASAVAVSNGGTLTLSVGGSGWTAANVSSLVSANSGRFASGSALGIDTTVAGFSYGTALSGNMSLVKLGANALTLTAANTNAGTTTVSGGTLQLGDGISGHDGSLNSTAGITNNASLVYNLSGSQSYSGVIGGFGTLTKTGNGVLVLQGASNYSGLTTVSSGTLQFGDGTSGHDGSLSSAGGIINNATLVYSLAGSQTYSGSISGTGSLTKKGAGVLTLAGTNNAYTGGTTVSAGTLAASAPGGLAGYGTTSTVTVSSGATLSLGVGGSGWTATDVGSLLSANSGAFATGSALGIDTTAAGGGFSYGSAIAGSMGLTKLGPNTLTLSASNTYTGGTVVAGGVLVATSTIALPNYNVASKLAVSNGGMLLLSVGGSGWTATDIGTLLNANIGGFATGSALGIDTSTAGFSCTTSLVGNLGLSKLGSNTLTLSAANTFAGPTMVSGGTLDLANTNALQGSTLVGPTAGSIAFDHVVSSHVFALGGLSGPGDIRLQDSAGTAVALNVGGNNGNTVYSGAFAGSGSLTKIGTGMLALIGISTHTGGTTISGGTLQLGNGISGQDGSLSSVGTITDNAVLVYNVAGSQTYTGVVSGTGSLTKNGAGTMTLTGTNSYSGGTVIAGGVLAVTNTGALSGYGLGSKVAVVNGGMLSLSVGGSGWTATNVGSLLFANSGGFTTGSFLGIDTTSAGTGGFSYGSPIGGSEGLTKLGANTLTLSGSNTYTGGTVVAGGMVAVPNASALPNYSVASKVTVNSGGMLSLSVGGSGWTATSIGNLLSANGGGFAPGSALGIDTSAASFCYTNSIAGNMGLTKLGPNTLTLTAANTFAGPTAVSGGTLDVANGKALQGSSLIAPTTGIISFDASVSPASFTFGGLTGSGNINLQNTAAAAIVLTVGGNNGNTTYSGALSGPGSLAKAGVGTLTLTGTSSFSGGITVGVGALNVASTGSLSTTNGSLYIGSGGPAAVSIREDAAVSVAGDLDVNYLNTGGIASTLSLESGSLTVTGQMYVGRAAVRTDPSNVCAAVNQSGGTAILNGLLTVGYAGLATSLYDISGGTLSANGGLLVGGNPANTQGNGLVNLHGSGTVNVYGSGLVIGQDSGLTTGGIVTLAGGNLNIGSPTYPASLVLGSQGGLATFSRTGGTMYVKSDLQVGGIGTLILDARGGSVATSFGHTLTRISSGGAPALGLLLVVPYTGDLGNAEAVSFGTAPAPVNGIIGPWAVTAASGTNTSADFLTVSGNKLATATYSDTNFANPASNGSSVENVSGSPAAVSGKTIYAMKVGGTASISSGQNLTIGSGGLIVNGGNITGGTLVFASEPLIFAGSDNAGTISSAIQTSSGLVKWGPGILVLSGNNTGLTGGVIIGTGSLNIQDAGALGPGGPGNKTTVAAGAALEIQGGFAVNNVSMTINGMGPVGGGAIRNVSDDNTLGGRITLGSAAQFNVDSADDTLTLSGPIQSDPSAVLTKVGSGTLKLSADNASTLNGPVTVAGGALAIQNGSALGPAGTSRLVTVQDGASLILQGGISVPAIPVVLSGEGVAAGGVLQSQDVNSFAGSITLAADSQVNVNSGSLTLSGNVCGPYALTKAGSGTLVLSGSNTFSEALSILDGALSVPTVNAAGSNGALGAGSTPVMLGSSGKSAVLDCTATGSSSSNRAFTLAAGGTGTFQIDQATASLTLSGAIDGDGNLKKTGSGKLTLSGTKGYTGTTTLGGGTLAIDSAGSINTSSGIVVGQGAVLQVTAGGGNQLPDAGTVTLTGGNFSFGGNGSLSAGESVGALVLGAGQNNITTSNTAGSAPYLRFTSGPASHTTGATVNFAASGCYIQFQANPPPLANGIIGGYAFYNGADFATWDTSGPSGYPTVKAVSYATTDPGEGTSGSINFSPNSSISIGSSRSFNSLKLTGSYGVTIGTGYTLTLNSGGLIAATTSGTNTVSGGTLRAANGELVVNAVQGLTVASAINAATALVKTGSANLTLTSPSSIAGNIDINQGSLEYAPNTSATYSGIISGAGNLLKSGTSTLTLSGNNTYIGTTTVSGGLLCVNGSLAAGSAVIVQGASLTGSGAIAGSVTVSGGTIAQSSSANIAGTVTAASGTLTVGQTGIGDYLKTTGGVNVSGSATVTTGSAGARINGNLNYTSSSNSTFSGVVEGTGKTVTLNPQSGNPTLTLSGSNTYTGGTIIQGGTLKTVNTGALGAGGIWLNGGVLDLNDLDITIASLSGTAGQIITSTGTSNLTVNPASGVSTTFSGAITNGGSGKMVSLEKSGAGTLVVSGTDTYTGGTTVIGGTLVIASPSAIADGTSLTVGAGATFAFDAAVMVSAGTISPVDALDPLAGSAAGPVVSATESSSGMATAVPEPGSVVLLFAALVALSLIHLRRKLGR